MERTSITLSGVHCTCSWNCCYRHMGKLC